MLKKGAGPKDGLDRSSLVTESQEDGTRADGGRE